MLGLTTSLRYFSDVYVSGYGDTRCGAWRSIRAPSICSSLVQSTSRNELFYVRAPAVMLTSLKLSAETVEKDGTPGRDGNSQTMGSRFERDSIMEYSNELHCVP